MKYNSSVPNREFRNWLRVVTGDLLGVGGEVEPLGRELILKTLKTGKHCSCININKTRAEVWQEPASAREPLNH